MEWLVERHPEYVERLAVLASAGRIEIVGGAFYEPILTMISTADRVGQISRYSEWLGERFGVPINGMWIPERVWEQSLTRDIATAGIRYTLLDDFHFKNAGLGADELHGYYVTEDETKLLAVMPGQRTAAIPDSLCRAGGIDQLPARRRRAAAERGRRVRRRRREVWHLARHEGTRLHDGWLRGSSTHCGQPRLAASGDAHRSDRQVPPAARSTSPRAATAR